MSPLGTESEMRRRPIVGLMLQISPVDHDRAHSWHVVSSCQVETDDQLYAESNIAL
jgi:hypothetical protein